MVLPAYSHAAAKLQEGGLATHAAFTLRASRPVVDAHVNTACAKLQPRVKNTVLFVLDECSMLKAAELDSIVWGLDELEFRGAVFLMGNMAQLPPVVPIGEDPVAARVTASDFYVTTTHHTDCENQRLKGGKEGAKQYHARCLAIGYGLNRVRVQLPIRRYFVLKPVLSFPTPQKHANVGSTYPIQLPRASFPSVQANEGGIARLRRWGCL